MSTMVAPAVSIMVRVIMVNTITENTTIVLADRLSRRRLRSREVCWSRSLTLHRLIAEPANRHDFEIGIVAESFAQSADMHVQRMRIGSVGFPDILHDLPAGKEAVGRAGQFE